MGQSCPSGVLVGVYDVIKGYEDAVRSIVPEMFSLIQVRYRVLQMIDASGPIGRRVLIDSLQLSEREVRNETTLLKEQNLIEITQKGMISTEHGRVIIEQLKPLFQELSGLKAMETTLSSILGINKVIIVPGDLESDQSVSTLLGKEAVTLLMDLAKKNNDVAVTGGSSVAALANHLSPVKSLNTLRFIAARGSIGEELENQANTLVAEFANKCKATYRTLYFPEYLSEQAYELMLEEPKVKEMLEIYDNIDLVIHGIGTAKEMATRRNTSSEIIDLLKVSKAVGEAFGYYFDESGQIVYRINTIGIQLEQVKSSPNIIAIAGGANKAKALNAYFKNAPKQTVLITDEACANRIIEGL